MLVDALFAILRAQSFAAFVLQAAGATFFLAAFGRSLGAARDDVQRVALLSALAAIVLVLSQYLVEVARMTGALSAIADPGWHEIVLTSSAGTALSLRALGLVLVATALRREGDLAISAGVVGGVLTLMSFAFTGHTPVHPQRWLLAPLLVVHLLVLAFWFGALAPLHIVSRREPGERTAALVGRFSVIAGWLVPGILIVGAIAAVLLIPRLAVLAEPYGLLLTTKILAFAVLMALAAANKWRFGPAIARGDARAIRYFQRTVTVVYLLIVAVLSITAVITGFYSPDV